MAQNEKNEQLKDKNEERNTHISESVSLDDEQRVKVLSPAALVFKRFIRNKLAITGIIILALMFAFAFIGGLVTPYDESQVFKKLDKVSTSYASATYNSDLRYTVEDGESFEGSARSAFLFAMGKNKNVFSDGENEYSFSVYGEDLYLISGLKPILKADNLANKMVYTDIEGGDSSDEIKAAFETAVASKESSFTIGDQEYIITNDKRSYNISVEDVLALATMNVYDVYDETRADFVNNFAFKYEAECALQDGKDSFEFEGKTYTIEQDDQAVNIYEDGTELATISGIIVQPVDSSIFLTVDMKNAFREAIAAKQDKFEYDGVEYTTRDVNGTFMISSDTESELIEMYATPSAKHPLGTDQNGMDVLTRLMYGGKISLLVGFVVVIIEMVIGVILGGISGYFGGWVDTCVMRFVDLFNCIPTTPMLIIIGSVLDANKINPKTRIYLLMVILGVLGWTGIARTVRGQILSLREQDFMVATEATGIRVSRRIARHLVPNVMPLLIVQATMSLGSIIITEATLSFLGLGVKYPFASWGSIINSATNIAVMTHYWFMWIPAGILILITVLGFNFVGDGLRDAFDPRMKR